MPAKIAAPAITEKNPDFLPPTKPAITKPKSRAVMTMAPGGISGSTKKSLNWIAMNSLSRTATQKIGSEKRRKEIKVMT